MRDWRSRAAVLSIGAAVIAACGSATVGQGGVGQRCFSDNTCNSGLTCASDVCVAFDAGAGGGSNSAPPARRAGRRASREPSTGPGRASFPHTSQVATPRLIASREAARAPAATASEQSMWRGKSVAPPTPVRLRRAPRRRAVRPVHPLGKSNAETGTVGQATLLATDRVIAPRTATAAVLPAVALMRTALRRRRLA